LKPQIGWMKQEFYQIDQIAEDCRCGGCCVMDLSLGKNDVRGIPKAGSGGLAPSNHLVTLSHEKILLCNLMRHRSARLFIPYVCSVCR